MVRPLFGFILESKGLPNLTRSFDLDGDDSTGYPDAATCARATHRALHDKGHPSSILIQLWTYYHDGDRASWQVEYKGERDLGNPHDVGAMTRWVRDGAPVAFVARLTGNKVDRLTAIVTPCLQVDTVTKQVKRVLRLSRAW